MSTFVNDGDRNNDNEKNVKTVRSIREASYRELDLPNSIMKYLDGVSAQELVKHVRNGKQLEIKGIGKKSAATIYDAVDKAGFIFHESNRSQAYRRLLENIVGLPTLSICGMQYEELIEISLENQMLIDRMISRAITAKLPQQIIRLHYGLDDGIPCSEKEIAAKLGLPRDEIKNLIKKELQHLKHPDAGFCREVAYGLLRRSSFSAYIAEEEQVALDHLAEFAEHPLIKRCLRTLSTVYGSGWRYSPDTHIQELHGLSSKTIDYLCRHTDIRTLGQLYEYPHSVLLQTYPRNLFEEIRIFLQGQLLNGCGWWQYTPIEEFGFSSRTCNCLKWMGGVHYIGQLYERSTSDLLKIRNFGQKSLNEVQAALLEQLRV